MKILIGILAWSWILCLPSLVVWEFVKWWRGRRRNGDVAAVVHAAQNARLDLIHGKQDEIIRHLTEMEEKLNRKA